MLVPKIYLVITPFFPEPGNFRGPYVLDQVKALQRVGNYRVVVIKPYPVWQSAEDYVIDGVQVYRCPSWKIPSNILPNRISDRLSSISLKKKLKNIGIELKDLAVCHTHVASLGFYALAIKDENPSCLSIVQHHGFDVLGLTDGIFSSKKWHEHICISYGRRICNAMDLNIGVSRKTLDYVRAYSGINLKREYVLYNGVDTAKFYPPERKVRNERFTIGCIANFWPLKDQMTLIKAVERIIDSGNHSIMVRFIGTGQTRQDCEDYIAEKGLSEYFIFENEVMHDQLLAFYHSIDLFVLPSYWEAFGCVYTEAYACGVPFMAVKGQGISEIIPMQDADKWLIEKGDDERLSRIICTFIDNPEQQSLSIPCGIDELMKKYITDIC